MHTPFALTALCAGALLLGACDKTPTAPPTPTVGAPALPMHSGAATGAVSDPSVPSAGSVLAPAPAGRADAAPGRSNHSMSAAQESSAMPMPGQNNDHSAPLGPARRASSP